MFSRCIVSFFGEWVDGFVLGVVVLCVGLVLSLRYFSKKLDGFTHGHLSGRYNSCVLICI